MPYATSSNSWPATVELNGTNVYYLICAAPESSRLFKVFVETSTATPPTLDVRALSIDGVPLASTLAGKVDNTPQGISAAGGVTNGMPMTLTMTNLTVQADGKLNGTNGVFFVFAGSTNRYWILGGE
jgi:hypothetical protein